MGSKSPTEQRAEFEAKVSDRLATAVSLKLKQLVNTVSNMYCIPETETITLIKLALRLLHPTDKPELKAGKVTFIMVGRISEMLPVVMLNDLRACDENAYLSYIGGHWWHPGVKIDFFF